MITPVTGTYLRPLKIGHGTPQEVMVDELTPAALQLEEVIDNQSEVDVKRDQQTRNSADELARGAAGFSKQAAMCFHVFV